MGVKGNSGGKKGRSGRKTKAAELGLQALLDKCWTQADREKCISALAKKAAEGENDAIKLLMSYTYGTPKATVDLNQPGGPFIVKVIYESVQ